jgi:hypothetical protein
MRNPVVSLALYTVWSSVDSISVTADDDGHLLLTIQDDSYQECQFQGEAWELRDWTYKYDLNIRIDVIKVNLDTKTLISWEGSD